MFDDLTDLPTTGHYIVERDAQYTLVTSKFVDVSTAVLDFADNTGVLAQWAAELYDGYIQSTVVATSDNIPATVPDEIKAEVAWIVWVAPVYWVKTKATRDYLMKHECIDPFNFDIGTDVIVV